MPIRINLLAEDQAAEEARRKDPVKRATWIGAFFVFLMLLWYSTIMLQGTVESSRTANLETQWTQLEPDHKSMMELSGNIRKVEDKLTALNRLATNRFLNAPVLNALQHTTVEDIVLTRMKLAQSYKLIPPVMDKKDPKKIAQPAKALESVVLELDARDLGDPKAQTYNRFIQSIRQADYFSKSLRPDGIRLTNLLPPGNENGSIFVAFTLECRFPEIERQ